MEPGVVVAHFLGGPWCGVQHPVALDPNGDPPETITDPADIYHLAREQPDWMVRVPALRPGQVLYVWHNIYFRTCEV